MDAYFLGSLLASVESKYFYILQAKKVCSLDFKERRIEEFSKIYFQLFIELPICFLVEEIFEMLEDLFALVGVYVLHNSLEVSKPRVC